MTSQEERSEALLEAHVKHMVERLAGPGLEQAAGRHVDALFAWLDDVRLGELVCEEQVMSSVDRFVIELRLSGGITELAGEIARVVIRAKEAEGVRLVDVLPTASFEDFAEKIQRFDRLREDLIGVAVRSQAFSEAAARLVSQRVAEALSDRLSKLRGLPLLRLGERLEGELLPQLERRIRAALFVRIEQHRAALTGELQERLAEVLDADFVRALLDDLWAALSGTPLSEVFALLGEQDLEDLVVTVLEFWLRFRKSPYLRAMIAEGVRFFFAKYSEESVADVIADMGVTRQMVYDELVTYLRPVLVHAAATGFLAERLREELAPFYGSEACKELLER